MRYYSGVSVCVLLTGEVRCVGYVIQVNLGIHCDYTA